MYTCVSHADRLSHRNTYAHVPSPLKIVILNHDVGVMKDPLKVGMTEVACTIESWIVRY